MFLKIRNSVAVIPNENPHTLQWSFKPISLLTRCFAVDLKVSSEKAAVWLIALRIFGSFTALFSILFAITKPILDIFFVTSQKQTYGVQTTFEYILLSLLQLSLLSMEIQIFYLVLTKWTTLWKVAEEMEKRLQYQLDFNRQLRKFSNALVVVFLVLVRQTFNGCRITNLFS